MRTDDSVEFFKTLYECAQHAAETNSPLQVQFNAESNYGQSIELVFNNDDMEREEMRGVIIVDWDNS